jgi:hypothetical protein
MPFEKQAACPDASRHLAGHFRMLPQAVDDRTTPKLLRETGTPERDNLCPYVPPRTAVSLRAESALWAVIGRRARLWLRAPLDMT